MKKKPNQRAVVGGAPASPVDGNLTAGTREPRDSAAQKRTQDLLVIRNQVLQSINELSLELAHLAPDELCAHAVKRTKALFNVRAAWISVYDPDTACLVVAHAALSDEENSAVARRIGARLTGYSTPVDEAQHRRLTTDQVGGPSSLPDLPFGAIPASLSGTLEKLFGSGWSMAVALVAGERLAGTLVIVGHPGQAAPDREEFLAFARSTASALEHKRVEQERQRLVNALAHASRVTALSELATSLAHELNQPLTAIMANASAALRMLGNRKPDMAELRDILTDIVAADERASAIIRRMHEPLKRRAPHLLPLTVNDLVREVELLVRNDARLAGADVALEVPDGLPPLRGDRVQLQQVILNLVMNALDAVRESAPDQRHIEVRAGCQGEQGLRLEVSDSGPGVPDAERERIFEAFCTTKPKGLGLGLSICRSLVEAHGGRIWAETRPKGGAKFVVVLPAEKQSGQL